VPKAELIQLEGRLLEQATQLYHEHRWEEALATFAQLLAVVEKIHPASDHAMRGAIVNNIGSCLHNLGEFEAAKAYYEAAVDSFNKTSTPMVDRLLYGDINKRRIHWVKARIVDVMWERQPEERFYLDGNGVKRQAPDVACASSRAGQMLSHEWLEQNLQRDGAGPREHRPTWLDDSALLPV